MSDTGQRGRLVHNEQFAAFYGSVAFKNAPNLHAGLCVVKSARKGGSDARCFAASPLAFLVFLLSLQGSMPYAPMPHSTFLPLHLNIARKWASFGRTKN